MRRGVYSAEYEVIYEVVVVSYESLEDSIRGCLILGTPP